MKKINVNLVLSFVFITIIIGYLNTDLPKGEITQFGAVPITTTSTTPTIVDLPIKLEEVKEVRKERIFTEEELIQRASQFSYIERFKDIAKTEMEKFNIPASITLAQGLLESGAGESSLAADGNNHFGIKFTANFAKDLIDAGILFGYKDSCNSKGKDCASYFTFETAWTGYRAHSLFLQKAHYVSHTEHLDKEDYKAWAKGLKKGGYATDKRYAEKLINLIEDLNLDQYDR